MDWKKGPSLYRILGVGPDATRAGIKEAYRRQMRLAHPDVSFEQGAEERARQLNYAYKILSNDAARAQYDRERGITVSPSPEGDYTHIREAIEKARPGARICVRPGLYRESLILNKRLEIVGDGPVAEIIIEGVGSSCIQMHTDQATVSKLTLRGRAGENNESYPAVWIPGGQLVLKDCHIESESGTGVTVSGAGADPVIRNCRVHSTKGNGLYFLNN
ncbi:MAG TPA: DnaJ domain-containing protein, partial [Blastocatellia bacterium]|nr:DnaJ domain-containing protein [Blastocatellia bacterium]